MNTYQVGLTDSKAVEVQWDILMLGKKMLSANSQLQLLHTLTTNHHYSLQL